MGIWVNDKPLRDKRLRGKARPVVARCPPEETPRYVRTKTESLTSTNYSKLKELTIRELLIKIISVFPGIRSYIVEELVKRARSDVGIGTVSSELPRMVKSGILKREKDGDSFRYFLNENIETSI